MEVTKKFQKLSLATLIVSLLPLATLVPVVLKIALPDWGTHDLGNTYSALLEMLPLTPTHQAKLLQRGFSDAEIVRLQYKSTPAFRYTNLTQQLIDKGYTVEGVPGFYFQKETGLWSINFHQRTSGFLIPVRSLDGKITALQIRLDRPFDEGRKKYLWLSSSRLERGTACGSPVHLSLG